jgi:hypothetical protein
MMRTVARQTGFQIQTHWLELSGLCPRCQSASSRSTPGPRAARPTHPAKAA